MIRPSAMVLALVAGAAQTSPASAQIDMSRELDRLHDAATALAASAPEFQGGIQDVARVHGAVVALRAGDDPHRLSCMMDQASLLADIGQLGAARAMVEQAAASAERSGDLALAADAWVTAVLLARRAGDPVGAEQGRQRAEWLATSTRMGPEESARVAARLSAERWKIAGVPPGSVQD